MCLGVSSCIDISIILSLSTHRVLECIFKGFGFESHVRLTMNHVILCECHSDCHICPLFLKMIEATGGSEMSKLRWVCAKVEVDKRYKVTSCETQSSELATIKQKRLCLDFASCVIARHF